MADVVGMNDPVGEPMKMADSGFVINPDTVDEYEATAPFQRFMKVLIDEKTFPGTPFSVALSRYPSGATCPSHSHWGSTEVYFILEGGLIVTIQDKEYRIREGELIYIPPSAEHRAETEGQRRAGSCR
jgi:mannose-6-phosphate isomerase-like protein (cupin superfamily)